MGSTASKGSSMNDHVNTFVDHGQTWIREARREFTRVDGHALVVIPTSHGHGYHYVVMADSDGEVVHKGEAGTRAEARRLAVFALAKRMLVWTPEWRPPPADLIAQALPSGPVFAAPLRVASHMILGAIGLLMVFAIVARLASACS